MRIKNGFRSKFFEYSEIKLISKYSQVIYVIKMTKNKILTLMLVGLISIFLVTSAATVALSDTSVAESSDPALMEDDEEEDEDEEDEDDDDDSIPSERLIGHEEAFRIAFENYNGTLVSFEFEREDNGPLYEIEIAEDGTIYVIEIEATSGEIIDTEEDELDDDFNPEWGELIGHEEALNIALQRVDGMLVEFELGEDEDTYIYEIEVREMRREYELDIDAYTGEVLGSEVEDPDETRRKRGVGGTWNGTQGDFTSFDLLENGIANYTLHTNTSNLLLFNSVIVQDMIIEETETQGAKYEIEADDTEIRIFDVAPALMKIDTESEDDDTPGKVSFDLGDLEVNGQEGNNLNLTYENRTAKLLSVSRGEDDSSVDIEASEGFVNYTFEGELFLVFRMTDEENMEREHHHEREREREMERNISNGISGGNVGGEVIVDRKGEGFSDTSVSYADMQMMTQVQEKIRVMVSSDTLGDEGKIVSIRIYREVLDADSAEELEITFDGEEIDMADGYSDLQQSDDAQYLVSIGSERIEVLVSVPHFSTHSIEVGLNDKGLSSLISPQYFVPVAVITALIVLTSAWLVKKEN